MRELIQGIALGILLATGVLALVFYTTPKQVVTTENEKDYTVDGAISYLQEKGYEVDKKDSVKVDATEEKQPKEDVEKESKEKAEEEKAEVEKVKEYQLVIKSGMNSYDVALLLHENGIIDDAEKLNQFLEVNDYQSVIRTGTYQLNDQMDYEQVARAITN